MATRTEKEFDDFVSQLKETHVTLSFYSDFEKISKNVSDIAISLNMLNYLLGKQDLRKAVEDLWQRDKSVFEVMDILIATREKDRKKFLDEKGHCRTVHSLFGSIDGVMKFLEETGLAKIFRSSEIKDLTDYVFGVETGLDSNSRKNRSGAIVEKTIAESFTDAGIEFEAQVSSKKFPEIEKVLGRDQKVFDFVVRTPATIYLIEVNFYSGGGSKQNEVSRSYTDVASKVNGVPGYEFVWVTDGCGLCSAKNKLQEAFSSIPLIYNFATFPGFLEKIKIENGKKQ